MDWALANFRFVKCYIDDIIIFILILRDQMIYLWGLGVQNPKVEAISQNFKLLNVSWLWKF